MSLLDSIVPAPLPETRPFWDGLEANKLIIQQCASCRSHFFPPGLLCPHCTSRQVTWIEASGRASLFSYVITHRPWPMWNQQGPMSVALVELDEGPRLVSTIVDCPQTTEDLKLDARLRATFRAFGEGRKILCFLLDHDSGNPG